VCVVAAAFALPHHWLLPINCYTIVQRGWSRNRRCSAVEESDLYLFTFIKLLAYLDESDLMPSVQSAYRRNHSTETAVMRVLSDILLTLDRGDFAAVALLDLLAAFDAVDHDTLSSTRLVRPPLPALTRK